MSVIARPRWAGQPSKSIIVDRENPLARGLATAIVPGYGPKNLAGYERTFFGSTVSAAGGVQGRQVAIIKQTGTQTGIRVEDSLRQRTAEITGFVLFRRTGTVDNNADIWWKNWQSNAGPTYVSWSIALCPSPSFGQNDINAIVGVSGGITAGTPYTAPSLTNWTTAAIVKRSGAHDLYVNGVSRVTTTSGAIVYGASGNNDLRTNLNKTQPVDIAVGLTWNRALTATEIAFLSANPWQIFVPQRRVIYSIVGGGAYTITADAGSYALTGQNATVLRSYAVAGDYGSYALTGQAATLSRSYAVAGDYGSYALAGQDASLLRSFSLDGAYGTYTVAGQQATLSRSYAVEAAAGSYATDGQPATILFSRLLDAASGSYSVTGQGATVEVSGQPTPSVDNPLIKLRSFTERRRF